MKISQESLEKLFPKTIGAFTRIYLSSYDINVEDYKDLSEDDLDYGTIADVVYYVNTHFNDNSTENALKGINIEYNDQFGLVFSVGSFDLDTQEKILTTQNMIDYPHSWGYNGFGEVEYIPILEGSGIKNALDSFLDYVTYPSYKKIVDAYFDESKRLFVKLSDGSISRTSYQGHYYENIDLVKSDFINLNFMDLLLDSLERFRDDEREENGMWETLLLNVSNNNELTDDDIENINACFRVCTVFEEFDYRTWFFK